CVYPDGNGITAVAATDQGGFVSFNCETGTFNRAGSVELYNGVRWKSVLRLPEGRQGFGLAATPAGSVLAVGSAPVGSSLGAGAVWAGGADGLTRVAGLPVPLHSLLEDVAFDGTQAYAVGEDETLGPGPLVLHLGASGWANVTPPRADRVLSGAA